MQWSLEGEVGRVASPCCPIRGLGSVALFPVIMSIRQSNIANTPHFGGQTSNCLLFSVSPRSAGSSAVLAVLSHC